MPQAKTPRTPKPKTTRTTVQPVTNGNGNGHALEIVDLEVEIRTRAFQLYAERGFTSGDERQDWLIAEQEVKAKHATAGA
jgi:hypothetical protein